MAASVQDEAGGTKAQEAFPQVRELVHKGSPDSFGCHNPCLTRHLSGFSKKLPPMIPSFTMP